MDWWLPTAISKHAIAYDSQFNRTLVVTGIIFAGVHAALVWTLARFRSGRKNPGVDIPKPTGRAELLWTGATLMLFLGLLALGGRVWAAVQFAPAPADAEKIEVLGKQFAWNFRYPGPDGRFGRRENRLANDAAGNPFGLDENDPAAKDDIVSSTLRVPAGRPVELVLIAQDVIHSFFVRELRMKQDVVPGMKIPLPFVADVPGTFEIPCAELCGLGHSQMRTTMLVLQPGEYDRWKREQVRP